MSFDELINDSQVIKVLYNSKFLFYHNLRQTSNAILTDNCAHQKKMGEKKMGSRWAQKNTEKKVITEKKNGEKMGTF